METKELAECIKSLSPKERDELNGHLHGHGITVQTASIDPLPPDNTHPPQH